MNELRLFDPLAQDPFEDTWRSMMRPWRWEASEPAPRIRVDLAEQDGSYYVKADIPGVRKEDIDIRIDGNMVTISAEVKKEAEQQERAGGRMLRHERHYGFASRAFTLASAVDESKADAKYENGVLELKLPKKAAASTKRLSVH
jgi:HSP20 family protein